MTRWELNVSIICGLTGTFILAIALGDDANASNDSPLAEWRGFDHHSAEDNAIYLKEFRVRETLIASCMRGRGLNYTERSAQLGNQGTALTINDDNVLSFDNKAAEENYFLMLHGERDPAVTTTDLDANKDGALSYEERFGYGCSGDAHRRVLGVFAARSVLAEKYNALRLGVMDSEAVREAEETWKVCMNSYGFEIPSSRVEFLSTHEDRLESGKLAHVVSQCDRPYRSARARETRIREAEFVRNNRDVLETYGVRVD